MDTSRFPCAREAIACDLAPTGVLRVAVNIGNQLLARLDEPDAVPTGVSVDLAHALASTLGVDLSLIVCSNAKQSVSVVSAAKADLGFFAVDPLRADSVSFSDPYLLIEGSYLVKADSPITRNEDVDHPNNVVVVSAGSAYDLYLTRALQHATIDRSAGPHNVVETFLAEHASVAAGIRPQLQASAQSNGDLRLLDGRFMVIEQAIGMPRTKRPGTAAYVSAFLEDLKERGWIACSLAAHGIEGATVAPRRGAVRQTDLK